MNKLTFAHCSIKTVLVVLVFAVSQLCMAADKEPTEFQTPPGIVVNEVTHKVIDIIKAKKDLLKTDPESYYQNIRQVLEVSVSFENIASNVMGTAGQLKKGASKEQRQKLLEQRKQFTEVFTLGMVKTLGKGLANYADLTINTLPSNKPIGNATSAGIIQEVMTANGQTRIEYHMRKRKSGEWLLVNVILDGINLRDQFQSQFKQSMKVNGDDIDKVISDWGKTE